MTGLKTIKPNEIKNVSKNINGVAMTKKDFTHLYKEYRKGRKIRGRDNEKLITKVIKWNNKILAEKAKQERKFYRLAKLKFYRLAKLNAKNFGTIKNFNIDKLTRNDTERFNQLKQIIDLELEEEKIETKGKKMNKKDYYGADLLLFSTERNYPKQNHSYKVNGVKYYMKNFKKPVYIGVKKNIEEKYKQRVLHVVKKEKHKKRFEKYLYFNFYNPPHKIYYPPQLGIWLGYADAIQFKIHDGPFIPVEEKKSEDEAQISWDDIIADNDIEDTLTVARKSDSKKGLYCDYLLLNKNKNALKFQDYVTFEHCDYVKHNFKSNACFLTAIINRYNKTFKNNKNCNLTYEYLIKFFNMKDNNYSLCISCAVEFFKFHRLFMFVYDSKLNLIFSYVPEKPSNKIDMKFYCIAKNEHIFLINNNINSISHLNNEKKDIIKKVSNIMTISKPNDKEIKYFINSSSDLLKIGDESEVNCTCSDIYKLLFEIYETYNPRVCYSTQLNSLHLKIDDQKINIYSAEENDYLEVDTQFKSKEETTLFIKYRRDLKDIFLKNKYMSWYNKDVQNMFDMYRARPDFLTKKFNHKCDFFGLDDYRSYTSILYNQLNYIVTIDFDSTFEAFDGVITDNYFYLVKCDNLIICPLKYSLIMGFVLKEVKDYKIIYQLKTKKINIDNKCVRELIDNLYNENIDEKLKKNCVNYFAGDLEKSTNRKFASEIYDNLDDVINMCKTNGGGKIELSKNFGVSKSNGENDDIIEDDDDDDDIVLYLWHRKFERETVNNFKLIKQQIYNYQKLNLIKKIKILDDNNIDYIGIKTDSTIIPDIHDNLKKVKELFKIENKFGSFKIDANSKIKTDCTTKQIENELYKNNNVLCDIVMKNEFDDEEAKQILDEHKKIFVSASYPGCGKSTIVCKGNIAKDKILFVCRNNRLRKEIIKRKFECVTLHKILGLNICGITSIKKTPMDISKYDCIIFDEIFLFPRYELRKIYYFMQQHEKKIFRCTGDSLQIPPISNEINDKDEMENAIKFMFSNELKLSIIKRVGREEDKNIIKSIKKLLFESNIPKKNWIDELKKIGLNVTDKNIDINRGVSFHNASTAQKKSLEIHKKKYGDEKYPIGLKLLGKEYYKFKQEKGNYIINSNCEYTVVEIKNDIVTLNDDEINFKVPLKSMENHFKYGYVETCDSIQGLSIDGKYMIYDANSIFMSKYHLYVALTRTTDTKNIYIFDDKGEYNKSIQKCVAVIINKKLKSYTMQDQDAKREIKDFITAQQFAQKLYSCSLTCYMCKTTCKINVENMDGNFTLDRIDNSICHTNDNTLICCESCNKNKSSMDLI
jgi:hypothetical protein